MERTSRTSRAGVKVKKKITKEQMQLAIIKKKECDAKALAIVERLLEPQIDPEWLVQNLKNINRCHMEDVIEERAITRICGYVLCKKPLTVVYKQQYHISLKSKKVFDITKRKNFCSSACFGASNYLLEQMLTSPLWIRDKEDIPTFRIFSKSLLKSTTPHGEEVDIVLYENCVKDEESETENETESTLKGSCKTKEDNVKNTSKSSATKSKEENVEGIIQDFVLHTIENIDIKEYGSKETSGTHDSNTQESKTNNEKNINTETVEVEDSEIIDKVQNVVQLDDQQKETVYDNMVLKQNNVTETEESKEKFAKEDELVQHVLQDIQCNESENTKVEQKIESNNEKNKSDDESDFIEQYVYPIEQSKPKKNLQNTNKNAAIQEENKNVPNDNVEREKPSQNVGSDSFKEDKKQKMSESLEKDKELNIEKLKRLKKKKILENKIKVPVDINLAARVEQSFQEWISEDTIHFLFGDETIKQKAIKNIEQQDKYTSLCEKLNRLQFQEEQEDVQILEKPVLKPAPHFAVLQEEGQKLNLKVNAFYQGKTSFEEPIVKSSNSEVDDTDTYLPLTESHAPQIFRRKIFLDRLDQVLPDLLRTLAGNNEVYARICVNYVSVRCTAVKALINTFSLSAKNIFFKTAEWTLVGLVIIKMLSLLDPWIANLLSTKQANLYISMILTSYKLDLHYLNLLVDSFNPNMNPK